MGKERVEANIIQNTKPLIIIGLGTYNRPSMLTNCLRSLSKLEIPIGYDVELMLVDNDANQSSKMIFGHWILQFNYPISYHFMPQRGIASMRNVVLDAVITRKASMVAFLDDDETAQPNWLVRMLDIMQRFDADVVHGRVERFLPKETPNWLIKGGFFESKHRATGLIRKSASTSNVLFKSRLIDEMGLRFHLALNMCGSSDTHLFAAATRMGAKIVWCDEALIQEYFPASRANASWIRKRAFRRTNSKYMRNVINHGLLFSKVAFTLLGTMQLFLGAFLYLTLGLTGKIGQLKALQMIWKGLGCWNGVLGRTYQEYLNTHGH